MTRQETAFKVRHEPMRIAGRKVEADGVVNVHYPYTNAVVGTVPAEELSPARQVELARAYIDLGDNDAARDLLQQALAGRDPVAREIATRMLREIE